MISLRERFRNSWALVGPWPIEPFYLGFLTFFMVASLYSLGDVTNHSYLTLNALIRPIFSTLIALLTLVQLRILIRVFPNYLHNIWIYLSILTFQAFSIWSWIVLLRNIFPTIHSSFASFLSPVPVFRFLFTLLCINGFIGLSRSKLTQALEGKEEVLKLVEDQRNLLLEYDEKTRSNLSEFLHDRVQSSLVTACLELQDIQQRVTGDTKNEIRKVINSLENLRAIDVRNASQALSPAIANADLQTSISVMAESYAPHIEIRFESALEVERIQGLSDKDIFLAVYRIIEQAFLNSHIHGKSTKFNIRLSIMEKHLLLQASNDGAALKDEVKPGLGTAIINAWVRSLRGKWKIENNSQGEVVLEVQLPLPALE